MSEVPYKLLLNKGANSASIEIDSANLMTLKDSNLKLSGVVSVADISSNNLYTLNIHT